MRVPSPLLHPALGRKLVYSPELMPMPLVGMGALGLEISLGGAAAAVASRMIPIIAQGFLLPGDWRHGSERTREVFTKWPVSVTDSAVCAGRGLRFGRFVPGRSSAPCVSASVLPSVLLLGVHAGQGLTLVPGA